jgi:hypothetical protein
VKSRATPRFWAAYYALPADTRKLATKCYRHFVADPQHPGLRFKRIHNSDTLYSVRAGYGYRAVGLLEDDEITWIWIGSHADYDRLLGSL